MGKDQLRVVVDTNVLLSVLLFGGRLEFIRKAWKEGRLKLLFSKETLEELVKVLHYPKFGLKEDEIDYLIYIEILPYSEIVEGIVKIDRELCRDKDDVKFLECAVLGKADFIVSGDSDLTSVGEIEGIKIISPADLRRILK